MARVRKMLRVAIIGCGKIADQHLLAINRIPDCKVIAACDRELLMADQLAERFGVASCFSDAREMLATARPDVVHVTTPPQSHFALGKQCLERGSHLYLEKPFTVTADEAEFLIGLATQNSLKITAGHNYQFTPPMLEMRRLTKERFLGGEPVHLESYWSYDLSDLTYVGPMLGNRQHWVRQLPGQLLHNVISHGIAKLAEFLDEVVEINAWAEQSSQLRQLGGQEVLDELRVMIRDKKGTTAFFCFSSQLRPGLNLLRVYGPENSLVADILTGSLIRSRNRSFKSYLTYFLPPLLHAQEHLKAACANITNFVRQRLYQDFGMKELIERFYDTIRSGAPPPIRHREIILTARIMDEIFAQIYPNRSRSPETGQVDESDNKLLSTIR